MVNENQFDPEKELWPRAPFTPAVHPTARKAVRNPDGTVEPSKQQRAEIATGVSGGDLGALRVRDGVWEIFVGDWRPFDPSRPSELHYANMAHRYGYWSFGDPRSDDSQTYIHSWEVIEKEEARLAGREPRPFPSETITHYDLIYHPTLRDDLFRRALILEPPTSRTDPPTVEPPKPPEPPIGLVDDLRARLLEAETTISVIQEASLRQAQTITETTTKLAAINKAAHTAAGEVAKLSRPGGKPLKALDKLIEAVGRLAALPVLLLCLLPLLSGCAAFRALMPGGVTPADAEWSGVKSGPHAGLTPTIAGVLDPRAEALASLLPILGQGDPLGVVMPVSLVGEPAPRWVLCTDAFKVRCESIPVNAVVHFAGTASGLFWKPKRLTFDNP